MNGKRHGIAARGLAFALCLLLGPLACVPAPVVAPESGVVEYRAYGQIAVPGGAVDAVGGNLMLSGVGISLDTPLGTQQLVPIWNSTSGSWQWSHLIRYDGQHFTDASGAVIATAVPDGAPIPGTGWTRLGARVLRTRGGLRFQFRPDGSLEHVRWATLDYPRIAFAPVGVAQCVSASSCALLFALENAANGQPLAITDARSGRVARFAYDGAGRIAVARTSEDVARSRPGRRYEYSGSQLVAATSSAGLRVEYAYQAGGRIRSVTQRGEGDPAHVFDFYGRNAWGQHRTVHRNPLGGHTTVYFDKTRRVLRVQRFEAGENVTLAWDALRPTRIVDAGGAATELVWQQERVVERVTPGGNRVRTQYAPGALSLLAPELDAVLRIDDSLGPVVQNSYDASGRPVALENGAGEAMQLSWNGASLVRAEVGGVVRDFPVFGAHGHWLDSLVAGEVVARRAFDVVGNELVPSDRMRNGGALSVGFDADRREASLDVAASDDGGHVTATAEIGLARDEDGALLAIDRPGDGDTVLERDALGRVVRIRERAQGAWRDTRIEYDAAGNQTAHELANGMRQEWEYDVFGRVLRHLALRNGVLEGEQRFTWQNGRIAARSDSLRGGGEVFVYDPAGRTASVVFGYGETISYTYDARDRVSTEVYSLPGVGVVAHLGYAYDGADRRNVLADLAHDELLVRWQHQAGRIASIQTGNGLLRSFTYDARGALTGSETRDANGALVEQTSVSFAPAQAPPRLEVRSVTETPLASTDERYWLPLGNSLGNPDQRVGKRVFGWSRGSGTPRRYAWDELGNPAPTSQGDSFGYDAERSRLLTASLPGQASVSYGYDAAGFAVVRNGVALGWDALGRLTRHGGDTLAWDMAGRPIRITQSGVTREFRFFGGRVEGANGALGTLDLGDVVISLIGGTRRYRHFDFREQVSFVSDDAGALVAHYRYQPFGVDAGFGPEAGAGRFENRPAFAGFFLLGARVLDPLVGRFLSPDPVLQVANQYSYALGNPVGFEDADGLNPATRADLAKISQALLDAATVVAAFGVLTGAAVAPVVALLGGTGAAIRLALAASELVSKPPPPPRTGSNGIITYWDPRDFAFSVPVVPAASFGCAPLGLTRVSDASACWLLGLLVLNSLLAGAWWWRERRAHSACS